MADAVRKISNLLTSNLLTTDTKNNKKIAYRPGTDIKPTSFISYHKKEMLVEKKFRNLSHMVLVHNNILFLNSVVNSYHCHQIGHC